MTTLLSLTQPSTLRRGLLSFIAAAVSTAAQADSPFTHPALEGQGAAESGWSQASAAAPRLIGHPASPRWTIVHANGEHPAVMVSRRAAGAVDPNTFLVQPPATARWTNPQAQTVEVAAGQAVR